MKSIFFRDTPTLYYHNSDYIKEIHEKSKWNFMKKTKSDLVFFDKLFATGSIILILYFMYF
ncbi:MAG: hypothetical protein U9N30_01275 [Campylobacterota bacterium]|nr:hypothetical protein [Campylobacterota bacterium]